MLTNRHVVTAAIGNGTTPKVIQPGKVNRLQKEYELGAVVHSSGFGHTSYDCAVVALGSRGFANEVPNHPWRPGNRALQGFATAAVNDTVYKYGATTGHTRGTVKSINFTWVDDTGRVAVQNAILIEGDDGHVWCNGGDSGSVVVLYESDLVVGLNFRGDTESGDEERGYTQGLAYDIGTQIRLFSNRIELAVSPQRVAVESLGS